jgi:hypothetical protein
MKYSFISGTIWTKVVSSFWITACDKVTSMGKNVISICVSVALEEKTSAELVDESQLLGPLFVSFDTL